MKNEALLAKIAEMLPGYEKAEAVRVDDAFYLEDDKNGRNLRAKAEPFFFGFGPARESKID